MNRSVFATTIFAALISAAGCSQNTGEYARVSGKVTLDGSAVDGAKVKFISTTEAAGGKTEFSTTTDSNGKYMIAGWGNKPGVPPGMYKVTITKLVLKPGVKAEMTEGFDSTQLEMSGMGVNQLPKTYAEESTSKLTATLDVGKNENVDFDLKAAGGK